MTFVSLRFTPEDRRKKRDRLVPIEVPAGARGVEIELEYDSAAATIDLGLFDPGGFRGYSGSVRRRVAVTPERATPGYLPGDIGAGEWCVHLGLHRVRAPGVDLKLRARTRSVHIDDLGEPPPVPERPPARELPASEGRRWLCGDLHAHTHHSDGRLSLDELAANACALGLDFLAVTDHNTISHHRELPSASKRYGLQLIPGQEVTTPRGHANCLGDTGWIDWRRLREQWVADAHASGGLLSINHPTGPDQIWPDPMPEATDLVEVWHGRWDRLGEGAFPWWSTRVGVPVGGSDFHNPDRDSLACPTTWVEAEDHDVLEALRAGRVVISSTPEAPVVLRLGDEVSVIDGEGMSLTWPEGRTRVTGSDAALQVSSGPFCLRDDAGRLVAFTP